FMVTPTRLWGWDIMAWSDRFGALTADKDSVYGQLVRRTDAFPGWRLRLPVLRRRMRVVPRTIAASNTQVCPRDGSTGSFDAVIWATGYCDDSSWLTMEGASDERGNYVHERGHSPVPGLYHIGRHWQNTRSSALLCGVGREAAALMEHVTRSLRS